MVGREAGVVSYRVFIGKNGMFSDNLSAGSFAVFLFRLTLYPLTNTSRDE